MEILRADKERLDREVAEYQAMIRRLQTSRARISEANPALQDTVSSLKRSSEVQTSKTKALRDQQKQLLAIKQTLEKQVPAETEAQLKRREVLEGHLQKVKVMFEEENEKRGQLENVKMNLEMELLRMRKLITDEYAKRRQLEQAFKRELEALKGSVKYSAQGPKSEKCQVCMAEPSLAGLSVCQGCASDSKKAITGPVSILDTVWRPPAPTSTSNPRRLLFFVNDEPHKPENQQLMVQAYLKGISVVQCTSTSDAVAKLSAFADELKTFDVRLITDMTRIESDGTKNAQAGFDLLKAMAPKRPPWSVLIYSAKEQNLAPWKDSFPSGLRCTTQHEVARVFVTFEDKDNVKE